MKKFLALAVLTMAASQIEAGNLSGRTFRLACPKGYNTYKQPNGLVKCLKGGRMGAKPSIIGGNGKQVILGPNGTRNLIGGNGKGVQVLNTKGGIQLICPAGQTHYLNGGTGRAMCVNKNSLGIANQVVPSSRATGRGGSGTELPRFNARSYTGGVY